MLIPKWVASLAKVAGRKAEIRRFPDAHLVKVTRNGGKTVAAATDGRALMIVTEEQPQSTSKRSEFKFPDIRGALPDKNTTLSVDPVRLRDLLDAMLSAVGEYDDPSMSVTISGRNEPIRFDIETHRGSIVAALMPRRSEGPEPLREESAE